MVPNLTRVKSCIVVLRRPKRGSIRNIKKSPTLFDVLKIKEYFGPVLPVKIRQIYYTCKWAEPKERGLPFTVISSEYKSNDGRSFRSRYHQIMIDN